MKCWAAKPDCRPSFRELVQILSGYTETLAGYLDMTSNPFIPASEQVDNLAAPSRLSALYYNIAGKLMGKSPKGKRKSPRSSPRLSPRVSPSVTPRLSPRASPQPEPPTCNTYILPPVITIEASDWLWAGERELNFRHPDVESKQTLRSDLLLSNFSHCLFILCAISNQV